MRETEKRLELGTATEASSPLCSKSRPGSSLRNPIDMGRSSIVVYYPGETTNNRHKRRRSLALSFLQFFKDWCARRNLKLIIIGKNSGVWKVQPLAYATATYATWRPYRADLRVFSESSTTVYYHCHDVAQLIKVLERSWSNRE